MGQKSKPSGYSPRLQEVLKAEAALGVLHKALVEFDQELPVGADDLIRDHRLAPGFDNRFLSDECLGLLKELKGFGIEAGDVLLLCFDFAPRRAAENETFTSVSDAKASAKWLRQVARKLRRLLRSCYLPISIPGRQGNVTIVPRAFPPRLVDGWLPLLGPITTARLWEVAGTDTKSGLLEECAEMLGVNASVFRRPPHRPRNFSETLFILAWEDLARRKAKRPLDFYGARLHWVVFGRPVDVDTFRRLRLRSRRAKLAYSLSPRQAGQKPD